MSTSLTKRQQIVSRLRGNGQRETFVESNITNAIAFQVRATRERHGWSQVELAQRAGLSQQTVARLEDPNYAKVHLPTLLRLAAALDIGLVVRFAPYSEIVDWQAELSPEKLAVASFDEDNEISEPGSS